MYLKSLLALSALGRPRVHAAFILQLRFIHNVLQILVQVTFALLVGTLLLLLIPKTDQILLICFKLLKRQTFVC